MYFKGPALPASATLSAPTVIMVAQAPSGELVLHAGFAQAYYAFHHWTELKYDCFSRWVQRLTDVSDPTPMIKVCACWGDGRSSCFQGCSRAVLSACATTGSGQGAVTLLVLPALPLLPAV